MMEYIYIYIQKNLNEFIFRKKIICFVNVEIDPRLWVDYILPNRHYLLLSPQWMKNKIMINILILNM
jgi:hypothetical protein